jgi:site-specific recombinase XerD
MVHVGTVLTLAGLWALLDTIWRALSDRELARLLADPDLRTTIGIRDRAILELLARAGLRRSELAGLALTDVQERDRQLKRQRSSISARRGNQTPLEVVVRDATRGRTRNVPLHAQAHDALRSRYAARPAAATDALFVSMRPLPSAPPEPISARAVSEIVAKPSALAARGSPHRSRIAPHLLHDARRSRRRARSDQGAWPATPIYEPRRSTSMSAISAEPTASRRSNARHTHSLRDRHGCRLL